MGKHTPLYITLFKIMRIYQPIKNNPYILPKYVYMSTVYLIRDIGKYKAGITEAINKPWFFDSAAAVNKAYTELPKEYADMIYKNVAFEEVLPDGYRNKTTTLIKARFIHRVAELMNYPI